jgi:hypothetical protein
MAIVSILMRSKRDSTKPARSLKLGGAESSMVRFSGHLLAAALLIVAGSSSLASAQPQPIQVSSQRSQIGFTGGMSIDPEQGFVGVFWRSPEIGRRFHIRPGIEGGFGDGLRLATFNIDFLMRFPIGSSGWDFIQGGGPTIVVAVFDLFDDDESELSAGGSYIFGFGHDSGFLGEFRIGGGGNVPSLKLTAGYAFVF